MTNSNSDENNLEENDLKHSKSKKNQGDYAPQQENQERSKQEEEVLDGEGKSVHLPPSENISRGNKRAAEFNKGLSDTSRHVMKQSKRSR